MPGLTKVNDYVQALYIPVLPDAEGDYYATCPRCQKVTKITSIRIWGNLYPAVIAPCEHYMGAPAGNGATLVFDFTREPIQFRDGKEKR